MSRISLKTQSPPIDGNWKQWGISVSRVKACRSGLNWRRLIRPFDSQHDNFICCRRHVRNIIKDSVLSRPVKNSNILPTLSRRVAWRGRDYEEGREIKQPKLGNGCLGLNGKSWYGLVADRYRLPTATTEWANWCHISLYPYSHIHLNPLLADPLLLLYEYTMEIQWVPYHPLLTVCLY